MIETTIFIVLKPEKKKKMSGRRLEVLEKEKKQRDAVISQLEQTTAKLYYEQSSLLKRIDTLQSQVNSHSILTFRPMSISPRTRVLKKSMASLRMYDILECWLLGVEEEGFQIG